RLLYATPPAEQMSASLGGIVAHGSGVLGYRFAPPQDSATLESGRVVSLEGRALFAASAVLPSVGQLRLSAQEVARGRVGVMLAIAIVLFVLSAWRMRRGLAWRAVVVAIGVICVAVAPLSAFSNFTALFDPALYYTPLGGPLTANAAALGLTSALVLLILLS